MGAGVTAFSTTRHGGCSKGNYAAFNINGYCGDDELHIAANKVALCSLLDISCDHLVMPHQVHGTAICRIDEPPHETIIGPGISLDSFEVGDEVYDQFAEAGFDMPLISRREAKWHIDLPVCNSLQLIEAGVPMANIQLSDICTYQQYDHYFSARRLGIQSGRIYTGILLK